MVGVAVAAALVAAAVPVFANGAGPASAANTAAAISRGAVVVCPTGTTRHRSAFRIERGGRRHGRQITGCKCLTGTGATGSTGKWGTAACNPCPAIWSASSGSATTKKLYAGHPILRRFRRIVRRVVCNPCPGGGSTGSTGSTVSMPTISLCNPCPAGGSTGSSGATGSPAMPDARILPLLRCHRLPCLSGASATANSSARVAWFGCGGCPRPLTSMARLFGSRGGISPVACNPCPATGSTGASGSTGATGTTGGSHPTILGRPAIFSCICPLVHVQWTTGTTGASGATSCAPPSCPQPLAAASRGAMWSPCCVKMGATGATAGACSPPPPVCGVWGSAGATGATGSTTGGGYACPAPPKPCISSSTAGGQTAQWCGGGPIPCGPPVASGQYSQGAHACPMVVPQSGASVSA